MNAWASLSLVSCVLVIVLGHVVYFQDRSARLNRIFALLCALLAGWAFSVFMLQNASGEHIAHHWTKTSSLFIYPVAAVLLWFALVFSGNRTARKHEIVYLLVYIPAVAIAVVDSTTNLISTHPVKVYWGFARGIPEDRTLYWISSGWAVATAALALILCAQVYLRADDARKREQAKYIVAGFALPLGLVTVSIVLLSLGAPLPDLTTPAFAALVALVGYGMYKHELFGFSPVEEAANVMGLMTDALLVLDLEGRIVTANKATSDMLGYGENELQGGRADTVFADTGLLRRILTETGSGDQSVNGLETSYSHRDMASVPVPVLMSTSPIKDKKGEIAGVVVVATDMTARRQSEQAVTYMAYHDPVTDLPNRSLFADRLTQGLENARRGGQTLALLYVDLDNFKLVNDEFGHYAGDLVLQTVGKRIEHCVRKADTVARIGGDEFTVLLAGIKNSWSAAKVAEKILGSVARPIALLGHEVAISASIGVSVFPDDAEDNDALISCADSAMYMAKERGRNRVQFFRADVHLKAIERAKLSKELSQAVERAQLVVYYQPIIALSDGGIIGAEALVRWQHPRRGLLLPSEFISLAEKTDLIIPIGRRVMLTACAQVKRWHEKGHPMLYVSVNVSGRQLRRQVLLDTFLEILEKTSLEARYLSLELTETAIMENPTVCAKVLNALVERGATVMLDDFGTGYSSLVSIWRFPVSTLKIDRSFIGDVVTDPSAAAIVLAILQVARSLGLKVVAEGVETPEQLSFLKEHGCEAVQGILFSPAISAEEFTKLLEEGRTLPAAA